MGAQVGKRILQRPTCRLNQICALNESQRPESIGLVIRALPYLWGRIAEFIVLSFDFRNEATQCVGIGFKFFERDGIQISQRLFLVLSRLP